MQESFIQIAFLIFIILGLVVLANKLRIAFPIVLVLGGLALSFAPIYSHITIEPEIVFFLFLPPLLYYAAWNTSWKDFWKWRKVISSFAFPLVIITACVVAFVSTALIPGFTLALGFLLGGIVSPPDAISATSIMQRVKAPRSVVHILEGESLLNDASSLIVFRFALMAVVSGQFDLAEATYSFFLVIIMGTLIGIIVGWAVYGIHRVLPMTPSIEIVLTLLTPYFMYYAAEHFHFSGVLAVVSGGLLLSSKQQTMLNYRSRVEAGNVWTSAVFILNGLVFLLIGLQLPAITRELGDTSLGKAIGYGLVITLVLMVARILFALGASVFTRFASHFISVADPNPGWKVPIIFGWAGMRGVVSLAAALSIPLTIDQGHPFPFRNLVLFITFVVILVTLIFQGLTLPWLIRALKPKAKFSPISEAEQEIIIQKRLAEASLQLLETKYIRKTAENEYLHHLAERLKMDAEFFKRYLEELKSDEKIVGTYLKVHLELLERQRRAANELNQLTEFNQELIRKYIALIDMEEYNLRARSQGIPDSF